MSSVNRVTLEKDVSLTSMDLARFGARVLPFRPRGGANCGERNSEGIAINAAERGMGRLRERLPLTPTLIAPNARRRGGVTAMVQVPACCTVDESVFDRPAHPLADWVYSRR